MRAMTHLSGGRARPPGPPSEVERIACPPKPWRRRALNALRASAVVYRGRSQTTRWGQRVPPSAKAGALRITRPTSDRNALPRQAFRHRGEGAADLLHVGVGHGLGDAHGEAIGEDGLGHRARDGAVVHRGQPEISRRPRAAEEIVIPENGILIDRKSTR